MTLESNLGGASPERSAAASGAPAFPKRFYKPVGIGSAGAAHALLLDDRPARTPGRNPLAVPTLPLAEAIAQEWRAVGDVIDPRRMPFTRLANSVIDGVSRMQEEVFAEIARFAASDLVLYRAEEPLDLVEAQRRAWDPIVAWSSETLGARLRLAQGVVHVEQPPEALSRISAVLRELVGSGVGAPYRLAALHVMTTLTGSALLAAAAAAGRVSVADAWSAAHVDEDYQVSFWGEDEEASDRRMRRSADMQTASEMLKLVAFA